LSHARATVSPPHAARVSQDFYAEHMRASQAARAGFLAERERWLRGMPVDGREELLFEFEMLLRGIERYFNVQNSALGGEPLVTHDFHPELEDVRDAINVAIKLARRLQDPGSDQKLVFRKYVETQLANDHVRRAFIEKDLDPDTPAESLFVLRESFDSLRTIIEHLLKLPVCNLHLFSDVGNLALREIVLNRYFRPFRPLEFRVEYDRLRSVRILDLLSALPPETRPLFTTAFLGLFRLLHYLSYVEGPARGERRVRVLLALVHSEAVSLSGYLRTEVAPNAGPRTLKAASLRAARDIARETTRLAREVLPRLESDKEAADTAAAAFGALVRAQVVALAEALAPGIATGEDAFAQLASPQEAALRLRRDLWVFAQLCRSAETALRADDVPSAEKAIHAIESFLGFFQDVSYQLLRYSDYEAFDRFGALLTELPWPPEGTGIRLRLAEDIRQFCQTLEATWTAVGRRALLQGRSFDRKEAETLRDRFLSAAAEP
jgi:hypothetical protein